jgi:hypothetical protein
LLGTDPARAAEILARARAEADRAVLEVQRIIDDLRPDVLDRSGLAGALREYADLLNARGSLTVDLDLAGLSDPASDAEAAVSRPASPGGACSNAPSANSLSIDPIVEVAAYRISQRRSPTFSAIPARPSAPSGSPSPTQSRSRSATTAPASRRSVLTGSA